VYILIILKFNKRKQDSFVKKKSFQLNERNRRKFVYCLKKIICVKHI